MKVPVSRVLLLFRWCFALSLILCTNVCTVCGSDTAVSESFDYPPGAQPPVYGGGTGWSGDSRKGSWKVGSKEKIPEPNIIAEGSLIFGDAQGRKFPATGNKALNGESVRVELSRRIEPETGALAKLTLPATTSSEQNIERSVAGVGAADGTIWFSAVVLPGPSSLTLRLSNFAYKAAPSGVSFKFDIPNNQLVCGQDWYHLKKANVRQSIDLPVPVTQPISLVAQLTFGNDWGTSKEFADFYATKKTAVIPEATGRLLVWLNPPLDKEPTPDSAQIDIPMLEFRFNTLELNLDPGASVDELRLGLSFDDVNH